MPKSEFVLIAYSCLWLIILSLLQVCQSSGNDHEKASNGSVNSSVSGKNQGEMRARQYFITNRDSYTDAANSFGGQVHGQAGNTYQVPQSSYNAPMGGYGGGYGYGAEKTIKRASN